MFVWGNLKGHKTPELMQWLCEHGLLPLYTPLSGSWLNMAESIQRILKRRALDSQHPETLNRLWTFEAVAEFWNQRPTPFGWGGKRAARRQRAQRQLEP
nr:transposase [Nodosilinea nodulosa]